MILQIIAVVWPRRRNAKLYWDVILRFCAFRKDERETTPVARRARPTRL